LAVALLLCAAIMAVACGKTIPAADSSATLASALNAAGIAVSGPEGNNPLDAGIFSIPGAFYSAAGEKVLAYEFDTEADAQAAAAQVTPDGYGIGSKYVGWGGAPHIHLNGRLIAVYIGDGAKVKETLVTAMGEQIAGEP
jgi:hypothetical protein